MDEMKWYQYFSDQFIWDAATEIMSDYTMAWFFFMGVVGGPIIYLARKIAKKTKWKSDDMLLDKLSERLGIPKGE